MMLHALPRQPTVIVARGALILLLSLSACGDAQRRCVDHEECFAGEFCDRGFCRIYNGRTRTDKRPDAGQAARLNPDPTL